MPDNDNQNLNSQTLVIDADQFTFETVEDQNGIATVVRFKVENPEVKAGDVLLILSGSDIHFHGLIGKIEEGWAIASDRHGSMLAARIH
ncbi:MAG: hypothetical protein L0226_01850 [Acidobacteria bacterium]|nr:hypothetical protein [Acidobacteriota bacterium]